MCYILCVSEAQKMPTLPKMGQMVVGINSQLKSLYWHDFVHNHARPVLWIKVFYSVLEPFQNIFKNQGQERVGNVMPGNLCEFKFCNAAAAAALRIETKHI